MSDQRVASEPKPAYSDVSSGPAPREQVATATASGGDEAKRDPYRAVVGLLAATALLAIAALIGGGRLLGDVVLFDVAVTLALSCGILGGVLAAQYRRASRAPAAGSGQSPAVTEAVTTPDVAANLAADVAEAALPVAPPREADDEPKTTESGDATATALFPDLSRKGIASNLLPSLTALQQRAVDWVRSLGVLGAIRVAAAVIGLATIAFLLLHVVYLTRTTPLVPAIVAAVCLVAAALEAMAAGYLADVDVALFPEAHGLAKAARVTTWVLALGALSVGLEWATALTSFLVVHFVIVAINVAVCVSLLRARAGAGESAFPVDLGPFVALGSRRNILASVLDAAERQLGIDLRSTWALTVVRRGIEPLVIALLLLAWLSTSLTVVAPEEEGLVERLGVPKGAALAAGLHVHWPWPMDRVYRLPVRRVQAIGVGHGGVESPGPENVLWSVQHAPNEFTLLLGNGRDLITIDAAVQYRIVDPKAWRYHCQNPATALEALAYRAVMRNTVNRTLSEALSENVAALTARMRGMVQRDADALGLGVQIVGFTVGGMHPPVAVARAYEGVVSAQITKATTVVNAQVFRNETLPAAEASVIVAANAARAAGVESLGRAAGEAWSFRTLQVQYRASPVEFLFRRRLETLERTLSGRSFTVLDARFLRDGGELWVSP